MCNVFKFRTPCNLLLGLSDLSRKWAIGHLASIRILSDQNKTYGWSEDTSFNSWKHSAKTEFGIKNDINWQMNGSGEIQPTGVVRRTYCPTAVRLWWDASDSDRRRMLNYGLLFRVFNIVDKRSSWDKGEQNYDKGELNVLLAGTRFSRSRSNGNILKKMHALAAAGQK